MSASDLVPYRPAQPAAIAAFALRFLSQ